MPNVRRLLLDVLKPHQPNALEFAYRLASVNASKVRLTVLAVDEHTESLQIEMLGDELLFDQIQAAITEMGASLHSIDEVDVSSD
ncbi:MAG: hypothetical protein ACJAWL_002732 [Motiliproteus sp.]|jgi:hypothetical protein